jgi:UDP-N-acetylmuramoylalanine--D-glutamate ligase
VKIAIAGYGVEGVANYNYYSSDPANQVVIVDQKQPTFEPPVGALTKIGTDVLRDLDDFDLVIRTAGLAPYKIHTNAKVWSSTNEFFSKCPAKIIGVTGTKGKGTTASLIASMLKAAGFKVWLVGNIGVAPLSVLADINPEDVVVYELSSFQLWDAEFSPSIAVLLFLESEHLDEHIDFDDYLSAKLHITKFQTESDYLVFNQQNQFARAIAAQSSAQKTGYQSDTSAHYMDDSFYYGEQIICSGEMLHLKGNYNVDNACAAIDAVWTITQDADAISRGIDDFKGLPHRLEFIRRFEGVDYYDDSIATTPGATIAVLRSFEDSKVIILGGSSKGSDFTELGVELCQHDVKAIIVGAESDNIIAACNAAGFSNYETAMSYDFSVIVDRARVLAGGEGVVLLSPACASFGDFKNYADRGDQFSAAVMAL